MTDTVVARVLLYYAHNIRRFIACGARNEVSIQDRPASTIFIRTAKITTGWTAITFRVTVSLAPNRLVSRVTTIAPSVYSNLYIYICTPAAISLSTRGYCGGTRQTSTLRPYVIAKFFVSIRAYRRRRSFPLLALNTARRPCLT